MLIKCVIFDFGNVIAFFDHRKACRQISKLSKNQFTEEEIYCDLFKMDGLEQQYDRGEIASDKFLNAIKQKFKISASIEEIQNAWCDIFFPNKLVIDLLKRLQQKQTRLMLASNTNELHYKWLKKQFAEALSLFDEEIVSFKIGYRKPELPFFDHCLERSGFRASECVFIDDRQEFVNVASQLGMKSIWYTSIEQFPAFLEEVGIQDDFLLAEFADLTIRPITNATDQDNELGLTLF